MGFFDVRVETHFAVTPERAWEYLADVGSHVEWMADARSIDFRSDQRQGVGTSYDCLTQLGPLKTVDVVTITEWEPPSRMGVSHSGVVTGSGVFEMTPDGAGTKFVWSERLDFPWFFGGRLGEAVAAPLFRLVWRRNLKQLGRRLDALS